MVYSCWIVVLKKEGTLFCVICVILWLKSCETAFLACSFVTQKKVPASFCVILRHSASFCVIKHGYYNRDMVVSVIELIEAPPKHTDTLSAWW